MIASGMRFRWRFHDADQGETVSCWHVNSPGCAWCCCGYPRNGIHAEPVGYYDDDNIFTSTHTTCDTKTMEVQ